MTTFSASNNIIFQCTTSKIPKVEECMKCRWTPLTLGSGSPCTSWTQSGDSDAIVDLLENNFLLSGKIVLHGTGQSVDLANLYYGEHQDHLGHNQVTTVLSRLPWKQLSSFRKDRATWHMAISWPRQLVLWWTSRPSRTQPGNSSAFTTSLITTFFFQEGTFNSLKSSSPRWPMPWCTSPSCQSGNSNAIALMQTRLRTTILLSGMDVHNEQLTSLTHTMVYINTIYETSRWFNWHPNFLDNNFLLSGRNVG